MQNNIPTLYILTLDSFVVKSAKISTILCLFVQKIKKRLSYCHGYRDASNVSLRSVLILCKILHVETMFGNEGEGFLHACISSYIILYYLYHCAWLRF